PPLCAALTKVKGQELRDLLHALNDVRGEAGPAVLDLLSRQSCPHADLAVEVLAWSRDPRVGAWLRDRIRPRIPLLRRTQWRRRPLPPRRPSVPADIPYRTVLRVLRHHPAHEAELVLVLAAHDWDPTYRAAAVGSLGWWEPVHQTEV